MCDIRGELSLFQKKMVIMAIFNENSNGDRQPGVLIVDDEPHIVDFLEVGFSYEGFRVLVATSGLEAIEMATMHQLDVIILDIMLPGLNGLEVMRRIRKASDVAVIMLTAKEGIDDRMVGLDTGADDYMTKPFALRCVIMAKAFQPAHYLTFLIASIE
jgi:DNA-binding response OmpR family regulator